jgi:hypothetical protein
LLAEKIGIEQQAGLARHLALAAVRAQARAKFRGTAVLPDDGVVDRLSRPSVPDDRGLALVGDADAGDVASLHPRPLHRRAHGRDRGGPDCFHIVLDLAGRRIDLVQLLLRARQRRERAIEDDGARRRGALIDGDQRGRHGALRAASNDAARAQPSSR